MDLETEQHLLRVGEVPDHAPKGSGSDLISVGVARILLVLGELRMLEHVDDLEVDTAPRAPARRCAAGWRSRLPCAGSLR